MRLDDFAGDWRLERTITDLAGGRDGRFEGRARFRPDEDGLAYAEEGRLALAGAAPMAASRAYLWRAAGGLIEVRFPDGSLFHRFDPAAAAPEAAHDCPPDRYEGRYDFGRWPIWQAEWRVTGPRKDYRLVSRYRPAGQVLTIPA